MIAFQREFSVQIKNDGLKSSKKATKKQQKYSRNNGF